MDDICRTNSVLKLQHQIWSGGKRISVEELLEENACDHETVLDLIYEEFRWRTLAGERPTEKEFLDRFPDLARQLGDLFEVHNAFSSLLPTDWSKDAPAQSSGGPEFSNAVGELIGNRFEISEHLGQGTFANVWRAWDRKLRREVALKVPLRLGRFWKPALLREARAAAQLFHPNIVPVYEVADQADAPYIVTAYLEGGSLQQLLKKART